ncbi:MAG: ATP-binding protein [Promethearchaeota archaeon]
MEESKILEVLYSWQEYFKKKELINRDLLDIIIKNLGKEIIDIVGIRRSGKSSLLILLMRKLKLKESQILYVNFEDPSFSNHLDMELIEKIWQIYRIKINQKEKPYIFFDEIQVVPNWEKWVKKIRDMELAYIFITGSSSRLMNKEYATSLTGRHISFTLFPLSYKEYLRFNGFKIPKSEKEIIKNNIMLRKYFDEYLIKGGFPEIVITKNEYLLKNYFEDILYKDIILRHEIRNPNLLRRLAGYCLTNIAQSISLNSLKNIFKVSFDTIRSYIDYLEESQLIFLLPIFSYSLKVQEVNPKKIYCIDNGLRNTVSFKFSKDEGKLAENIVFLELKRREKEIFYWKNTQEVDFIVKNIDGSLLALNVSYTDNIPEREIKGLIEFKNKFQQHVKELILLTKDTEKISKGIKFIPIWKWLLENN